MVDAPGGFLEEVLLACGSSSSVTSVSSIPRTMKIRYPRWITTCTDLRRRTSLSDLELLGQAPYDFARRAAGPDQGGRRRTVPTGTGSSAGAHRPRPHAARRWADLVRSPTCAGGRGRRRDIRCATGRRQPGGARRRPAAALCPVSGRVIVDPRPGNPGEVGPVRGHRGQLVPAALDSGHDGTLQQDRADRLRRLVSPSCSARRTLGRRGVADGNAHRPVSRTPSWSGSCPPSSSATTTPPAAADRRGPGLPGDPGDELFLLFGGDLAVEQDGRQVAEVGPGAVLGEMALLEGGRRTATLRAVTRCQGGGSARRTGSTGTPWPRWPGGAGTGGPAEGSGEPRRGAPVGGVPLEAPSGAGVRHGSSVSLRELRRAGPGAGPVLPQLRRPSGLQQRRGARKVTTIVIYDITGSTTWGAAQPGVAGAAMARYLSRPGRP